MAQRLELNALKPVRRLVRLQEHRHWHPAGGVALQHNVGVAVTKIDTLGQPALPRRRTDAAARPTNGPNEGPAIDPRCPPQRTKTGSNTQAAAAMRKRRSTEKNTRRESRQTGGTRLDLAMRRPAGRT
jgi:hypothetical protein